MKNKWQPIDTAPRDSEIILGYLSQATPDKEMSKYVIIRWVSEQYSHGWYTTKGAYRVYPTYWRRLPKPPKEKRRLDHFAKREIEPPS